MSDFSVILVFMALFVASMVSFSFMIRSVHYYKSRASTEPKYIHVYNKSIMHTKSALKNITSIHTHVTHNEFSNNNYASLFV